LRALGLTRQVDEARSHVTVRYALEAPPEGSRFVMTTELSRRMPCTGSATHLLESILLESNPPTKGNAT